MSGRATLDEVATRAGVSRMTVSNVYNRPEVVAQATQVKVRRAAAALRYAGPSPAGRTLRRGRSGVLGLVVEEALPYLFTDPGTAALMHGITAQASERDLAIQVIHAHGPSAAQKVADSIVDGWVVLGLAADHPAMQAVLDRRLPFATTPGPLVAGVAYVTSDVVAGTAAAIDHLRVLGHERIAVITPPPSGPIWEPRLAGYLAAAAAAGLAVDVVECTDNSRRAGLHAGEELLAGRHPTAVVAATDIVALGVVDAARAAGVRIPQDLSVVGYDDVDEAASASLTTIRQDLFEQGREAARLAMDADGSGGGHLHPIELVVRASTASPRARR